MPLLDIKGEEVQIGDKVLCAVDKKYMALGVFEKLSKMSFIFRLHDKQAFSIPLEIRIANPAFDLNAYYAHYKNNLPGNYSIPHEIAVPNDNVKNTSIFKVDRDFEL